MHISVCFHQDAASFFAAAEAFLLARPVQHNILLTLVDERIRSPEPGRYWVAERNGQVAGVAFQSPLTRPALLAPMDADVVTALVDAIAATPVDLPGIIAEAATAASFAGAWTEKRKSAAIPTHGLRLYELTQLQPVGPVEGKLRRAELADRDVALAWMRQFHAEIHDSQSDPETLIDPALNAGQIWFWQNREPVSMAIGRKPVAGAVRVTHVYTPPENRKRGYAAACVYGLSKHFTELGCRCVLYADLGNPTSNSIYRQMGYKAVAEVIQYRFEC